MSTSQNRSRNVTGQKLTETFRALDNVIVDPLITVARQPFLLERHHLQTLIGGGNKALVWANNVSIACIGFTIALASKYLQPILSHQLISKVEPWEWIEVAVGFGVGALLCIVGHVLPSDYEKLIREIRGTFESNPPSVDARRGQE